MKNGILPGTAPGRPPSNIKACALLAVLVLASIAPFATRAVFIDEHIFLRIARSALVNPMFPADTPLLFFGIERPDYSAHTHPPVGEYYLAALYAVLGKFDEVAFRLFFAVFPVTAILSFYVLAKRFTREPLLVAALLAVSPAFFVMAPTLMMDIPMLAFLLAGLAFYFHGRLLPAAIGFILAAGTGYTALVPLACLGIVMILARRPWKELAAVAAAPAALAVWLLGMTLHFGSFPLAGTAEYLVLQGVAAKSATQLAGDRIQSVMINTLGIFSFIGGVSVFPGSVRLRKIQSWLGSIGLAAVLSLIAPMPSLLYRLWFIVLASCGIMFVVAFAGSAIGIIRPGSRNAGEAILILWVPAVLLFFAVVAEMINARYILLALPALYLIVFRESSQGELMATIVPTALLSIALAHADARFVNSYRTWVENTIPSLQKDGFRIFSASESGLRFYLEGAGVETLSQTDVRPRGSDLIVRQRMFPYGLAEDIEVVSTPLKRFSLEDAFPVRTFNIGAQAGFHDSHLGLAPFVLSREPYDEIDVTQINPLVRALPQGSTDPEVVPVYGPEGPVFSQSRDEVFFAMKLPSNIHIQYELDGGTGFAEQTPNGLRLVKTGGDTITWRRLRFTPTTFMGTGN